MRAIQVVAAGIILVSWHIGSSLSNIGDRPEATGKSAFSTSRAQPSPRRPARGTRGIITLPASRDGHVRVSARIGHASLRAIVDTGATVVALRESDARRVGIRLRPNDFTAAMQTANGRVRAAPVTLPSVEVAGLVVRNVPAAVLPDKSLATNLLGLSYLRRLDRYTFSGDSLTLEN